MGSAASATAVAGALGYDEGMRRSVYFWSHALPICTAHEPPAALCHV